MSLVVIHILLDAGIILVVTAIDLTQDDLDLIKTVINPGNIVVVWVGEKPADSISCDLHVKANGKPDAAVDAVKRLLKGRRIIFDFVNS